MPEDKSLLEIFLTLTEIEQLETIKCNAIYLDAIQAAKRLISALELSIQK